jgi:hypothetical protein
MVDIHRRIQTKHLFHWIQAFSKDVITFSEEQYINWEASAVWNTIHGRISAEEDDGTQSCGPYYVLIIGVGIFVTHMLW